MDMATLVQKVLGLVFPIKCLGCGALGEYVCAPCLGEVKSLPRQQCPHCREESELGEFCGGQCRDGLFGYPAYFDGLYVCSEYDRAGVLKKMITQFKYKFSEEIVLSLSVKMSEQRAFLNNKCIQGGVMRSWEKDLHDKNSIEKRNVECNVIKKEKAKIGNVGIGNDMCVNTGLEKEVESLPDTPPHEPQKTDWLVVPVPLHYKRQKERGFNQAYLLAKQLTWLLRPNSKLTNSLLRSKNTKKQAKLSRVDRLKNLSEAFSLKQNQKIEGSNVILIDDVCTTGSTINECAKVLKKAGAKSVRGFVLARGTAPKTGFNTIPK